MSEGNGDYYASDYVIRLSVSLSASDLPKVLICRNNIGKVDIVYSKNIIHTTNISLFIFAQTTSL